MNELGSSAWLIITALASAVASLAVYINKLQATRIKQLESRVELLEDRLENASNRTESNAATLERVVNASVDRERDLMNRLAELSHKVADLTKGAAT